MPQNDKIKKINQLAHVESFLQVNLVKGYKYVDRAGEIVNYLHEGEQPPKFDMSLNGLIIFQPDQKAEELKISSNAIWVHFKSPDSLELASDYFKKKVEDVLRILDVSSISRMGWRNYLVYETGTEAKRDEVLKKFAPITNLTFEAAVFSGSIKDTNLTIQLKKVLKNDSSQEVPGVLFDIDFYKKYSEPYCSSGQVSAELSAFKETIRSQEFLDLINSMIAK